MYIYGLFDSGTPFVGLYFNENKLILPGTMQWKRVSSCTLSWPLPRLSLRPRPVNNVHTIGLATPAWASARPGAWPRIRSSKRLFPVGPYSGPCIFAIDVSHLSRTYEVERTLNERLTLLFHWPFSIGNV